MTSSEHPWTRALAMHAIGVTAARTAAVASETGRTNDRARPGSRPLSSRDREILAGCAEGLPTAEIATRQWLSEGTVRNRVSEILGKLGVWNRVEAVQIARDNGRL